MKFLIIFLAYSCGHFLDKEIVKPIDPIVKEITKLEPIAELYEREAKRDKFGWLTDDCDSMLWNGLLAAIGDSAIDIEAARNSEGFYFRTPGQDCYPKRSASDFSKDMAVGLAWYFWRNYRETEAREYAALVKKNFGLMGRGPLERVLISSNLYRTFLAVGGEVNLPLEDVWELPSADHSRHVVILHILLRAEMNDEITGGMLDVVKGAFEGDRSNALFAYAFNKFFTGDQSEALAILSDERLFPSNRLPTSSDRCGRWLWERNSQSKHWTPCDELKTHTGGEFRFLLNLIKRDYLPER